MPQPVQTPIIKIGTIIDVAGHGRLAVTAITKHGVLLGGKLLLPLREIEKYIR